MKLTNEEIAKVFAMYQGQKVLCFPSDDMISHWLPPTILNWDVIAGTHYSVTNTILCLTPLAKITDEHAIEVWKVEGNHDNIPHPIAHVHTFLNVWEQSRLNMPYNVCQYLISKGYAVPLWFGIDHPANGKTAIELEIAIDKTLKPITS